MFAVLQVLTVILVVVALAPALAHALEWPGKRRLTKETYVAVQPIYYPGFTIAGGIGEAGGLLSTIMLLVLTPLGSADFWLTLIALLGLIGMQAVYWLVTHPVNRFWLQGEHLSGVSAGFFAFGSTRGSGRPDESRPVTWTDMRDRWEFSHVVRAGLAALSFIALVIALASAGGA
jgi:Domain of unknown function (DUF1772)